MQSLVKMSGYIGGLQDSNCSRSKKGSRDLGNYRSQSFISLSVNLVKTIIKNSLFKK